MNRIAIFSNEGKSQKESLEIKTALQKTLKYLNKNNIFLNLYLVSEASIKAINKQHRKVDKITNVLSFEVLKDFLVPIKKQKYIGEIYLCPKYIDKKNQNIKAMAIHGLLHLLGYDHIKTADRLKMEKKERAIFTKLKIGFFV